MFREGDVVGRKSYGMDLLFKIVQIDVRKKAATLKGLDMRLLADAPLDDLVSPDSGDLQEYKSRSEKAQKDCITKIYKRRSLERERLRGKSGRSPDEFFELPGKILHLDGDEDYLHECLRAYRALQLDAAGYYFPEKEQPEKIWGLLHEHRPDILILTGHDAFKKNKKDFTDLKSYSNSRYFVEATRKARQYEPAKDDLIIFAGACQSHYEAILAAGANFASAPQRVLIHAMDPVFITEKVAFTSINESVNIYEVIKNTITGLDGIGGVETKGKFRLGLPKSPY
ncbi:sporulation peptidase YabG [Dethiobacter alkaliphilus]|uniref:sporulation peptidase YabG n=1 Tax=Dethiobacter alkaliphilus TaxID=427926 RepID=UPI002225B884|nr:sporulation peptidase YabG [Dethiobacter alkaliphilus]MCW3489104.1 sporulation peptidase YabG [Dethiobacter alkaliphilus]